MDAAVAVTCSIISYPGLSSIQWEQRISNTPTAVNGFTARNDTSKMFSVITHSTIMVTGRDINGASSYCCAATNVIGTAVNCLDFGIAACFVILHVKRRGVIAVPVCLHCHAYMLHRRLTYVTSVMLLLQLYSSCVNHVYGILSLHPCVVQQVYCDITIGIQT